jgi:hypothetical protein
MAGYLSATRGPFVSYGNTPHSDQFDTTTADLPDLDPVRSPLVWPLFMLTCPLASRPETGHPLFVSTRVANS